MTCNIIQVISYKLLFLSSTTHFYCEVNEAKSLWKMPSEVQNSSKVVFSNSRPSSLRMRTMVLAYSVAIEDIGHKKLYVSNLFLMNCTQVYREKSSIHTKTYRLPPRLSTCIRPIRSMCRSSRTRFVVH